VEERGGVQMEQQIDGVSRPGAEEVHPGGRRRGEGFEGAVGWGGRLSTGEQHTRFSSGRFGEAR
jgi:hypothetical protein